ncbi:MAG: AraC family transcriptional regulator [Bacteroidales bacterium]|nr:AraC family transcriptional regulator [Bacteroidales bacterium]
MRTEIHIGLFDLFIFLGVFQGILISWFFIKNSNNSRRANRYQGILLFLLSVSIFEELLNNTGYIVRFLAITNYSEPSNFAFAPLVYLYIRSSLYPKKKEHIWGHFVISAFWLVYMVFQFIQPNEVKYNSYIGTKHPDWGYLDVIEKISDDPIGIRYHINELTAVHFTIYMTAGIVLLLKKFKSLNQNVFTTGNELLVVMRNTMFHFVMIMVIFLATKLYYGMGSDIGGYLIAAYISFMIFATSYQILNRSAFFDHPQSFLNFPMPKYQKSTLSEHNKEMILSKIKLEMEGRKYFTNNLASLSGLAKQINESSHHVSQVINELLNMNFFELLAKYRVEEAKRIILADKGKRITIEELAEQVGYNSKSAFNNAFKKLTSQTPSEFRENCQIN